MEDINQECHRRRTQTAFYIVMEGTSMMVHILNHLLLANWNGENIEQAGINYESNRQGLYGCMACVPHLSLALASRTFSAEAQSFAAWQSSDQSRPMLLGLPLSP